MLTYSVSVTRHLWLLPLTGSVPSSLQFNGGSALGASALACQAFLTTNMAAAAAMGTWLLLDHIRGLKFRATGACVGAVVGLVVITPAAGECSDQCSSLWCCLRARHGGMLVRWQGDAADQLCRPIRCRQHTRIALLLQADDGLLLLLLLCGWRPTGVVDLGAAALLGIIGSCACSGAQVLMEKYGRKYIDDTLDVFAVHGVGGTVGCILTSLFSNSKVNSAAPDGAFYGEWLVTLVSILTLSGC
jgi:ammonia channel protein AmtB